MSVRQGLETLHIMQGWGASKCLMIHLWSCTTTPWQPLFLATLDRNIHCKLKDIITIHQVSQFHFSRCLLSFHQLFNWGVVHVAVCVYTEKGTSNDSFLFPHQAVGAECKVCLFLFSVNLYSLNWLKAHQYC